MKSGFRLSFPEDSSHVTTCISGLSEDVELAFKDPPKFMTIDLDQMIKAFDSLEAHVASIHQSSERTFNSVPARPLCFNRNLDSLRNGNGHCQSSRLGYSAEDHSDRQFCFRDLARNCLIDTDW